MALVVDASIAFQWFIPEPDGEGALSLLESDAPLIAPDLIYAELGNAMWARLRTLAEGRAATIRAQQELTNIISQVVPTRALMPRAIEIGFQIAHPIYDCVYLALCEQQSARLITADKRLVRSVAETEFARWVSLGDERD